MTREERLELLKQIEKDIHVCSLESTLLDDAKSCAIHSVIEELEQEPTTKNYLGVDCIPRKVMCDLGATCIAYRNEKQELIPIISIDELPSVTPQEPILDKIRAEIIDKLYVDSLIFGELIDFENGKISANDVIEEFNRVTRKEVLKIIDKYKEEVRSNE